MKSQPKPYANLRIRKRTMAILGSNSSPSSKREQEKRHTTIPTTILL